MTVEEFNKAHSAYMATDLYRVTQACLAARHRHTKLVAQLETATAAIAKFSKRRDAIRAQHPEQVAIQQACFTAAEKVTQTSAA